MFVTAVLIALNGLTWGLWTLAGASSGANNLTQAIWYIYGPLVVLICTTLLPTAALIVGLCRGGRSRAILRAALLWSVFGFFPYACMSGGGV